MLLRYRCSHTNAIIMEVHKVKRHLLGVKGVIVAEGAGKGYMICEGLPLVPVLRTLKCEKMFAKTRFTRKQEQPAGFL